MHQFLTGEVQIGKTTVIAKTLAILQIRPGGFKTYFGPDRSLPERFLYMNGAAELPSYKIEQAVARFFAARPPAVFTEKFSVDGVALIRAAKNSAKLIVMDECGNLEEDALLFQEEVMTALDGNIPVLGVIKQVSRGWTQRIRNHPKVELITVTRENREELPSILAQRLTF